MFRFYYLIVVLFPVILYYIWKAEHMMKHEERYTMDERFSVARRMVNIMKNTGRIKTVVTGREMLPKEGGYIMYVNHLGRMDAITVLSAHHERCTVLSDQRPAEALLVNQVMKLINGTRVDVNDIRQQVKELQKLVERVKNGERYIYFPEGKYGDNGNTLQEFRSGAFKSAKRAQCPIVPVALYDAHLPFKYNSLRKVTIQVSFLEPIAYDDYKDMSTAEISDMVKGRIENEMKVLDQRRIERGYNRNNKYYKNR